MARAFISIFAGRKGQGKVGMLSNLRIGEFEHVQWAIRVVPSFPVLSLGKIWSRENIGPMCES